MGKRKWRIRWYDHLAVLVFGIIVAIVQFHMKPQTLETREDIITEIVLGAAKVAACWIILILYIWGVKRLQKKMARLEPPQKPSHIPSSSKPVTASMNRVQMFGFLAMLVIVTLSYGTFRWIWGSEAIQFQFAQFMLFFIAGIILHELFHAIGWIVTGHVSIRDVKFGIMWRYLAPYAHCKVPIPVWVHRFGTVLPGIVTGIIPTLVGLALGHFTLTLVGALLIGGAAGDVAILNLTRGLDRDQLVADHPSDVGFFIVRNNDPNTATEDKWLVRD